MLRKGLTRYLKLKGYTDKDIELIIALLFVTGELLPIPSTPINIIETTY